MKRWMSLLLLLALLCGCGNSDASGTEPTQTAGEPAQPASPLTVWDLPEGNYTDLIAVDGDLLLLGEEKTVRLSGQTMEPLASVKLKDAAVLRSGADGIACYEESTRTIHFLDEDLQQISFLTLPESAMGGICLTDEGKTVCYCTPEGVQLLDIATGVSRSLCRRDGNWLGISRTLCSGTVLQCAVQMDDGSIRTLYLSERTGEVLDQTEDVTVLGADGDLYFCRLGSEWIYGWGNSQPRNFWAAEDAQIFPLLSGEAVVTVSGAESGAVLDCFNLKTGKRTATLEVEADAIEAMTWLDGYVYFTDSSRLYCWDLAQTAVEDTADYMSFRYTREDPDEDGLQRYLDQAANMQKFYHVNIILWEDVAAVQPDNYSFVAEYIPENYADCFTFLRDALSGFSGNFFYRAADWTESGMLNIVLVSDIVTDVADTHPAHDGIQYLLNGNAYIVLELDGDLQSSFYHMLGHIIDIEVMSNSTVLYEWSDVNPAKFSYDNNYDSYENRKSTKYLSGSKQYFIDSFSMSFPVEDRATIFEYAMMDGNGEHFASKYMQVKLRRGCNGIREAFGLKGSSYPWEQYLN